VGALAIFPKVLFELMMHSQIAFMAISLCALGWSLWSIVTLGVRRSFLFAAEEDRLITNGPYQYHRHPQLISALVLSFSLIPAVYAVHENQGSTIFRLANIALMYALIHYTIKAEEKDLISRFGQEYKDYMEQVPGLLGVFERKKGKSPGIGKVILISIAAYCISIVLNFVLIFASAGRPWSNKLPVYMGVNFRHLFTQTVTHRDINYLARQLTDELENKEVLPNKLDQRWVVEWKKRDRLSWLSPYPQTLFFCDQKFYSDNFDKDDGIRTGPALTVVEELPFPLHCWEEHIEFAQAMDYDGDGFPQVWLVTYPHEDIHGTFKYFELFLVADDNDNSLSPEIKERLMNVESDE